MADEGNVNVTKPDYALILDNLRKALYTIDDNPYTDRKGSVFYLAKGKKKNDADTIRKEYSANNKTQHGKFFQKRTQMESAFLPLDEYKCFIDHYTPEISPPVELNKPLFWVAHLAGWKRLGVSPDNPQLDRLFKDSKDAVGKYGKCFKHDLEKTKFTLSEEGKVEFFTVGEDDLSHSHMTDAAEYIVLCNYQLVKDYVRGRKTLLRNVISDFAHNLYDAERERINEEDTHSMLPDNETEVNELCNCLNRMMLAYDQLPDYEVNKKDWLLGRSLAWLVIGAMLRNCLSMDLINSSLIPYLPASDISTPPEFHVRKDATVSIPELFWCAGKTWYEEVHKPGARFHSLDIIDRILPDASDKPTHNRAGHYFPFRAADSDDRTIQCSRFSELLQDKNSTLNQGHFMLIGEGGMGKTTTLMSAMYDSYEGEDHYNGELVIPLFVELSLAPDSQESPAYGGTSSSVIHRLLYAMLQQKDSKKDRSDLLRECMNDDGSIAKDTIRNYLTDGDTPDLRFVLLVDGLNEVSAEPFTEGRSSSAQGRILQELMEMADNYHNVTIVLTSRSGYLQAHPSFRSFYMRPLQWEEIESYLIERGKGKEKIAEIREGDKGLLEVLSVPMFLTMYAFLEDARGVTTRGELMKVFFHERVERRNKEYALHRQGDISQRIDLDEEQSVAGTMRRGKITLPMQWLFLDILIPEIAAKMVDSQIFQISEREVRQLLQSLFAYQDSLYCGKYKVYSNISFEVQMQGEDLEDIITDFTDTYGQKPARYCAAFLRYCESAIGILYKEGEHTYGFIHQHYRDYFAAVCHVNRMKTAYTALGEDEPDAARDIMRRYDEEPLTPVIMSFIGEYLGEHHNAPVFSRNGNPSFAPVDVGESARERKLITNLFDVYRGITLENGYGVYNLVEILKRTRKDLSGSDFHDLDLRKCRFYRVLLDSQPNINLKQSLVDARSWFAEGHTSNIHSVIWNNKGTQFVTVSEDGTAKIWNAFTGTLNHTLELDGFIKSAIYSPDGTKLVTMNFRGPACVWDANTGILLFRLIGSPFVGPFTRVDAVCWSPKEQRIVAVHTNGFVGVWDSCSGELVLKLPHVSWNSHLLVKYSPDGRQIAIGSTALNGNINIYDAKSGIMIYTLKKGIHSICWSLDGGRIVTVSDNEAPQVLDASTGEPIIPLTLQRYPIKFAIYSPDGTMIVTVSSDGDACVHDAVSGDLVHTLPGQMRSVFFVNWSPDSTRIAETNGKGVVWIWNIANDKLIKLQEQGDIVDRISWSIDSRRILTSFSFGSNARVWDADNGTLLYTIGSRLGAQDASYSSDGSRIITHFDRTTQLWDADTGKLLHTIEGTTAGKVWFANYNSNGSRIITASFEGTIRVWDANLPQLIHTIRGSDGQGTFNCYVSEKNSIITISTNNTIRIWDGDTGELKKQKRLYVDRSSKVSYSPDGSKIFVGNSDISMIVHAYTGKTISTLENVDLTGYSVRWNSDGTRIVTESLWNKCVCVWDVISGHLINRFDSGYLRGRFACYISGKNRVVTISGYPSDDFEDDDEIRNINILDADTGKPVHIFEGNIIDLRFASYSPDESKIVTADNRICEIWDVESGILLHKLVGHTDVVNSACWNRDGTRIVTASADNTVKVWDVDTGMPLQTIYEEPGLHITGVNFKDISPESKISDKQKNIFRQYGAII